MSIREFPISRNKVIIPKLRSEVLHRGRLLTLFGDLLDKKLILVTAPAGYGKTTLMVEFANRAKVPVCWLSLDSLDQDPQRFITYLIAAISERFPKFGKLSEACLRSLTDLEQDSESLLVSLTNEIHDRIDEHFALLIDDYHLVDPVVTIRRFLSRFIFLVGENCHVILASRRLPALSDIALMVARQEVGGFDFEQLAFQQEEVQALVEKIAGSKLTLQSVEDLLRQTEGWITGLLLYISGAGINTAPSPSGGRNKSSLYHAARSAGVNLASYFDQQILIPQSDKVREFLLQSSLLDEFNADLCNAVLGAGNWEDLIETAQRGNLFISRVGPKGAWVRYHPLFQEFLQQRIWREEPDAARAILDRLATIHEENGEWEKAHAIYQHFASAGLLADLLERAGTPLLLNERLITLSGWLDELPSRLLYQRPSLISLKAALLCARGDGKSALEELERAIPNLEESGDAFELALAYVRRAAAYRITGEHNRSFLDAKKALRLSDGKAEMAAIYAEAEFYEGISLNNLGRMEQAIQVHRNAMARFQQLGEPQSVARVQMYLGFTYNITNNYLASLETFGQALNEWKKETNLGQQASTLNSLGVLYHRQGEYKKAVQSFEQGLECARQVNSEWREALLLTSLGEVYLDLDEFEPARQAFAKAMELSKKISYHFLSTSLLLSQVRLARLLRHTQEATAKLNKAEAMISRGGSDSLSGKFHLERGCLNLIEGEMVNAQADFRLALDLFLKRTQPLEVDHCRIWLAAAMLANNEFKAASKVLKKVAKNAWAVDNPAALIHEVRHALPWLSGLKDADDVGMLLTTWQEMIAEHEHRLPAIRKQLRPVLSSVPIQAPHLVIQGFGRAQVRINGKLVSPADWKTNSVRELFFFLLSRRHPVTKDEIGEILWGEISPEQLKLRFKNNLYRLRCALGQDTILFKDERYSFNRLLDFDYDVENFNDQLAKTKLSPSPEEKIACLRAATILRQGPYLTNIDATWVLAERERLEQSCLAALKQLAELLYQVDELDEALQVCQEALKIDSCREDIHRLAMEIRASRGDHLGVILQYQTCVQNLQAELNMPVSEETETLYRRLLAG